MRQFIMSQVGWYAWTSGQFVAHELVPAGGHVVVFTCRGGFDTPWGRFEGPYSEQTAAITAVALNQQLQFLRGEEGL